MERYSFWQKVGSFAKTHLLPILSWMLMVAGAIMLCIEAYIQSEEVSFPLRFWQILLITSVLGIFAHVINGHFFSGFLKRSVDISGHNLGVSIGIKFGDIFEQDGWKVISTNDFFDYLVDDDLVSSRSLHGFVINRYWNGDGSKWFDDISRHIRSAKSDLVDREKGNTRRYPIGTTSFAKRNGQKLIFVAVARTDLETNITRSDVETLVCALRESLKRARQVCSLETLSIPLVGSGLARVGVNQRVLVDLILAAVLEEARVSKITNRVEIVLPKEIRRKINLQSYREKRF